MYYFKRQNGFSLIEIIVSMAIIGIISITFLTIFTSGFSNIFAAGNKSEALLNSQAVIEDSIAYLTTSNSYNLTIRLNGADNIVEGYRIYSTKTYNNNRMVDLALFIPKNSSNVPIVLATTFDEIQLGEYVRIDGANYQKVGENRVLKSTNTGSGQWESAVASGSSYYTPTSIVSSSSLLTVDELVNLPKNTLDNDSYWWTSTQQNASRAWFVDLDGNRSHNPKSDLYGIRPALTLKSGLNVNGGNGSSSNPYTLTPWLCFFFEITKAKLMSFSIFITKFGGVISNEN